nr:MAG TPA: hypothetical protein [Caudoviricetes sp.]
MNFKACTKIKKNTNRHTRRIHHEKNNSRSPQNGA